MVNPPPCFALLQLLDNPGCKYVVILLFEKLGGNLGASGSFVKVVSVEYRPSPEVLQNAMITPHISHLVTVCRLHRECGKTNGNIVCAGCAGRTVTDFHPFRYNDRLIRFHDHCCPFINIFNV